MLWRIDMLIHPMLFLVRDLKTLKELSNASSVERNIHALMI
jgi:hypothetical protein